MIADDVVRKSLSRSEDAISLLDAERLCLFYLFEDRKNVHPYHPDSSEIYIFNHRHEPKAHNG